MLEATGVTLTACRPASLSLRQRSRFSQRLRCARKEAVVTDAGEAFGEHMESEAAHELLTVEPHDLQSVIPMVFVVEEDAVVIDRTKASVGDGDAVSVTGQVLEDPRWGRERLLQMDDPPLPSQRSKKSPPSVWVLEIGGRSDGPLAPEPTESFEK